MTIKYIAVLLLLATLVATFSLVESDRSAGESPVVESFDSHLLDHTPVVKPKNTAHIARPFGLSADARAHFADIDAAVREGSREPDAEYWELRAAVLRADQAELAVTNGEALPGHLRAPDFDTARAMGSKPVMARSNSSELVEANSTEAELLDSPAAIDDNIELASNSDVSGASLSILSALGGRNIDVQTSATAAPLESSSKQGNTFAASPQAITPAVAESREPREQIADRRSTVRRLPAPTSPVATPSSKIIIASPAEAQYTNQLSITIEGSVELERNLDGVAVNDVDVDWRSGQFSTNVLLNDGLNTITAVADYGRRQHSATVTVTRDTDRPTMISAISTGTFGVIVQFSEGMNVGSLDTLNYSIVRQDTAAVLPVLNAEFTDPTATTVRLETGMQGGIEYKLRVANVKDFAGNPILDQQPEVSQNPSETTFSGTVATGADLLRDYDGDGLTDYVELQGWPVIVTRTDGTFETSTVYSDPFLADTDSDLISDAEERHGGMNPRSPDTDGDTLDDDSEWNRVYSDPTNQDTDGDGIQDGFEYLFFKTSPILADTDGDQLDDPLELIAGNRNPLIADLPSPDISVGNVNLQLNTTFTVTNEEGQTRQESKQNSATLTQSEDQTYSTSNETSTSNTVSNSEQITNSVSVESEVGFDDGFSASAKVSYGYENQRTTATGSERGSSQQFGESSSQAAEEQYQQSLETSLEKAVTETLTREIVSSSMKVDLTIDNAGDIPFTITNIELSAQTQDPLNRRRIIPVASLVPENTNLGSVNIGALGDPARGPFVFSTGTNSVFPQEIQELMKNPRGLIIQLANFDIVDQDGNNFAFTSQEVLDRTAGITFDLGDGRVESYRVATATEHDPNTGQPLGITMAQALEIVGLNRFVSVRDGGNGIAESSAGGDDVQVILPSRPVGSSGNSEPSVSIITAGPDGVIDAATVIGGDDIIAQPDYETALFGESAHLRDGGNGIVETAAAGDDLLSTAIVAGQIAPNAVIIRDGPNQLIDSVPLGDDILVPATREREVLVRYRDAETNDENNEIRFWVVFSTKSTDGIDFDDLVLRSGEQYDFTFVQDKDRDNVWAREEYLHGSSDLLANSDGDSLSDFAEISQGWIVKLKESPQGYRVYPNPIQSDSDRDGLNDDVEFACRLDPRQRDTDLDGLSDFEELFGVLVDGAETSPMQSVDPDGVIPPFDIVRYAGLTPGVLPPYTPILPFQWNDHSNTLSPECLAAIAPGGFGADPSNPTGVGFATNPLSPDTDGDFVSDADELTLGIHPNDTNDGGSFLDDDGDGLPNTFEKLGRTIVVNGVSISGITSRPNKADSDDDKLPDLLEFYLGSNPNLADTDGDGISDTDEYKNGGLGCVGASQPNCVTFLTRPNLDYNEFTAACLNADECDVLTIEGTGSTGLGNELQLGTNLNSNDTDGDGLTDNAERLVHLTNFFVLDSDADGLNDGTEVNFYGSNPANAFTDTDDFTFNDGQEVAVGRNPAVNDKRITVSIFDGFHNVNAPGGTPSLTTTVSPGAAPSPACTFNLFTTIDRSRPEFPASWADCVVLDSVIVSEGGGSYTVTHGGTFVYNTISFPLSFCAPKSTEFSYANTTDGVDIDSDAAGGNRVTCGPNYNFNTIYNVSVFP